jgi:DsbC/DsbD-like thiol-disulfide interchange protein
MIKIILLIILPFILFAEEKLTNEEKSNLLKVEVIPQNQYIKNNDSVLIAFKFKMQKHWHIYWVNSGDSGLPTEVKLTLKAGISESELMYPVPEKIPFSGYTNYGYNDEVILFKKIYIAKETDYKFIVLPIKISWLVCKEICIPQDTTISVKFVVTNEKVHNINWSKNLDSLYNSLPQQNKNFAVKAQKNKDEVTVRFKNEKLHEIDFTNVEFLPFASSIYDYKEKPKVILDKGFYSIKLIMDKNRYEEPEKLRGILIGRKGQFGDINSNSLEINCDFEK